MRIFLDSADPEQIRTAWQWGRIDGVTTNPSLVASLGRPYSDIIHEILSFMTGSLSLEVIATDYETMLQQARSLAALSHRVVVKIPCTTEGLAVVKVLSQQGIKTNVTLVFSLSQALLAAKAGATYCSVFIGRLEDVAEHSGDEMVAQVRTAYDDQKISTQLLAASIRNEGHFEQAALMGADIISVPFPVLERLIKHQLTDVGLQRFLDDWQRSGLEFPV
ncbi:MAG: transaldolase [Patescibacteria group bacterium]|jgi:transaldolase|nr:transaldolase [Patescibacteria group bacterium]